MADVFNMSDVMISYSRKDKAFVQRLEAALRSGGREVWVDWEDIPTGVDFMAEIFAGIEAANTFVFIISPDSVSSPVCLEEVRHAVTHKKRFIPILYREIDDQAKGSFHPALGAHNWFFFREEDDFDQAFSQLIKTLDTDIHHVRLHTRLLVRARDWESKGRTDSLLLRGDDLREAETWLMQNANKEPPPTELHREYILASRRAAQVRSRVIVGVGAALLIITVLALFAFNQSVIATEQAATATFAQGQAVLEANNAATQAAIAEIARATSDANALIALDNAATATIAQGEALLQAGIAATQAAEAQIARATSDYNALIALDNAATATIAQGEALIQANIAATQAAEAQIARATSDYNALIALDNAATATIAQGEALIQANIAATQAAEAERLAALAATQAAIAEIARATSDYNAEVALDNAATATIAQGQAVLEANNAATQAAIAEIARATSDANALIALDNAATATIAQGEALIQANIAATQAAEAQIARATSDYNALIALDNAATATIAQGEALIQANIAATEAAIAEIARATSDANALIALDNAATATIAQGEALIQAGIAATQAAEAEIARATSDYNAEVALDNAATATIAQGEALIQANIAATQAAIAQIARATSDYNALIALDNAATATIAQGEALIQAGIAATQAAEAEIARATSDYNAEVALDNAATATIAQGEALIQRDAAELNAAAAFAAQETAIYQANRAATQEALANFNAATAVAAQETVVAIQATAVAAANLERDFQATAAAAEAARARGLALSDGSEEVYNNGNPDLALIMALEASAADPTLAESYRALLEVAYAPGTRLIYGLADRQQHTGPVTSLAYSPDGQYVLSGSKDGTVKLWNAAAGTLARQFGASGDRHTFGVNVVAFSPDGTMAVSGDESGNMLLWDVATGEAALRFGASSGYERIGPIRGLVFLPNAANRVVSTNGLNLIAWDTRTGQIAARNNISAEALVGGNLAVSGNGAYLLLGSTIWGGNNISQRQRSFEGGWIGAFGLTSDTALVSLSQDSNEFVLREIVSQIDRVRFRGHTGNITALIFSPDGRYALSGAGGGSTPRPDFSLILWDAATGEPLRRYNGHSGPVNALAFSPDGRYIVSGSDDGQIRSWETTPTGELARYNAAYAVREMAFHPGGSIVALAYDDQSIALVDMNTGQELKRLYGQPNDFTDLFFSPDGGTLVSADISGTIIVWDTPGGSERRRFSAGDTAAFIALSPDAGVVYAGTGDGVVRAWNRDTGEVRARFTGSGGIMAVALSPDGAVLASAHDNPLGDIIILWDTTSGAEIRRFQAGNVRKMAFHPGGGSILVNAGNTLQLFSTATGEGRLFGSGGGAHASPILDLAFSPDGSAALSASVDDIRLWDVNSGRQVFGYRRGASALAYAPDGTTFAASYGTPFAPQSPENTLSLYRVGTRQQVAAWIAANRYLRELSCDEREQYNIPPLCDEAARALTPTPAPETGIVIAGQPINIRARPAETAQAITSVRPGTELVILARAAGWVNVRLDDGREGWMLEQFIQSR